MAPAWDAILVEVLVLGCEFRRGLGSPRTYVSANEMLRRIGCRQRDTEEIDRREGIDETAKKN